MDFTILSWIKCKNNENFCVIANAAEAIHKIVSALPRNSFGYRLRNHAHFVRL